LADRGQSWRQIDGGLSLERRWRSDDVPAKIAEGWFGFREDIEPCYHFTVERLFGDVAALIKRIKRVSEAIVKARQTRNLFAKKFL
jgi:hypothetical protein